MRLIKKLSRTIASALFTAGLGDAFDWVQSVPAGKRPHLDRRPRAEIDRESGLDGWGRHTSFKPSVG